MTTLKEIRRTVGSAVKSVKAGLIWVKLVSNDLHCRGGHIRRFEQFNVAPALILRDIFSVQFLDEVNWLEKSLCAILIYSGSRLIFLEGLPQRYNAVRPVQRQGKCSDLMFNMGACFEVNCSGKFSGGNQNWCLLKRGPHLLKCVLRTGSTVCNLNVVEVRQLLILVVCYTGSTNQTKVH